MELHKEPAGKARNCLEGGKKKHFSHIQPETVATLTCQDACQIHHPHFESFVDQFQRDSQQQLHQQVAHDVLHPEHVSKNQQQS